MVQNTIGLNPFGYRGGFVYVEVFGYGYPNIPPTTPLPFLNVRNVSNKRFPTDFFISFGMYERDYGLNTHDSLYSWPWFRTL